MVGRREEGGGEVKNEEGGMENRYLVMGVVGGRNMEWWASQNKK